MTNNHLFSVHEAADYICVSPVTLTRLRHKDSGPTYLRIGRKIRYRKNDLDIWLSNKAVATSDTREVL